MSLAWTWCGKEWRAQRGFVLGPAVDRLCSVRALGATTDGRYALVEGPARARWPEVLARVDLRTGAAVRLTGPDERPMPLWRQGLDVQTLAALGLFSTTGPRGDRVADFVAMTSYPLQPTTRPARSVCRSPCARASPTRVRRRRRCASPATCRPGSRATISACATRTAR